MAESVVVPASDGYGLRLVVDRKLWDLGTMVQQSASLASLAEPATLGLSVPDFERLGIADGATVTVELGDARHEVAVSVDAGLPEGAARIPLNLPGIDAAGLLSVDRTVTDIRVTAN